jgi:hypothetical protein
LKFGSHKEKQIKNLLDKVNDIKRLEKIKKRSNKGGKLEGFHQISQKLKFKKQKLKVRMNE